MSDNQPIAILDANNLVTQVIMASSGYVDAQGRTTTTAPDGSVVGSTYNGTTFVAPTLPPPPASLLVSIASQMQSQVLTKVWSFNIGTTAAPVIVTTKLDAPGQTSMQQLLSWGQYNTVTQATQAYCNEDYSYVTLSATQAQLLGTKAFGIVSQTFKILGTTVQQINAGTITSIAQVEAVVWPDNTATY